MIIVKLDLRDGKGSVDVAVGDHTAANRLRKFENRANESFADQKRWFKVRGLMTHVYNGPNTEWTIGTVMQGDDPNKAIDEYRVDPLKWSKAAGVEEF